MDNIAEYIGGGRHIHHAILYNYVCMRNKVHCGRLVRSCTKIARLKLDSWICQWIKRFDPNTGVGIINGDDLCTKQALFRCHNGGIGGVKVKAIRECTISNLYIVQSLSMYVVS